MPPFIRRELPQTWPTSELVRAMHMLACRYYEKEQDTAGRIVEAAATRLHRLDQSREHWRNVAERKEDDK